MKTMVLPKKSVYQHLTLILILVVGTSMYVSDLNYVSNSNSIDSQPFGSQINEIDKTMQGYAYHHATTGYDGEINEKMYIGRDFDFLNERWRGFTEFDISFIPDNAYITRIQIRLYISGKPEVCDNQRAQLGLFQMELQPSQQSYDFEALFEDIGNGTQYLDSTLATVSTDGYYPDDSSWIIAENESIADCQEALGRDWFAIGIKDYYKEELGHDSDQDEGIICEISNLEIHYAIDNAIYFATYNADISGTDTETESSKTTDAGNGGNSTTIVVIILTAFAILVGLLSFGLKRMTGHEKDTQSTNFFKHQGYPLKDSKSAKMTSDRQQLQKFKEILEISQRVKIADVAKSLNLEYNVLFDKLLEWKRVIPFKIDDDLIIVDNVNDFIVALDDEFQQWENREETRESKK